MLGLFNHSNLNYMNKNHCKFSRKLYFNYLKVVAGTSLFWILFDTLIIYAYFLDCFSVPECQELKNKLGLDLPNYPGHPIHSLNKEYFANNISHNKDIPSWRKRKAPMMNGRRGDRSIITESSQILINNHPKFYMKDEEQSENDHLKVDEETDYISYNDENGHNGAPVELPPELEEKAKELFHVNQFNLVASNLISPNRSLPDIRSEQCKLKQYELESLPNTSVLIVFHNEAWSTLIRTLWSVINRSQKRLLREIILVDDASDKDFLGKKLEDYISRLPVHVHLERMGSRSGLVRSRLRGVSLAKGQTITFLDAHCECTIGWLEPLLYQISIDRKSVVSPLIDVISDNNFEYRLVPDLLAGFDWKVTFDWVSPAKAEMERRKDDSTLPYRTPTMAGGLFTIDKKFFYEIGSYDDQMNIWGGENLEMSFRLWQCGSQVLISPCSRVGHVFRTLSPYTFPDGTDKTVLTNQMRTVEVWLDDHKKFYYKSNPAAKDYPVGDISERLSFKAGMKCKDFKWYLTNVYPDSPLPIYFFSVGHIRNLLIGQCIHISTDGANKLTMTHCFSEVDRQIFSYTKERTLMTLGKLCVTTGGLLGSYLEITTCSTPPNDHQKWIYYTDTHVLRNQFHNRCLAIETEDQVSIITLASCDGSEKLKWILEEFDEKAYSEETLAEVE